MNVKVGIVGCGAISTRRHIPDLAINAKATMVAFCDKVQSRAGEQAKKHGGCAYQDFEQMLRHSALDAVVIGTPNYLHARQTIAALRAGKHVLVEKPMATSREDAMAMIQAAKQTGKLLMVGQNQRLDPVHQKARQILASGRLGKVLTFRTAFKHPGPEKWCIDNSSDTWFFKKREAVLGVCADLGIHKADLVRYLLGEDFVEVQAMIGTQEKRFANGELIEVDDNAMLMVKSASGVMGSIILSWTNYGEWESNYTVLYCQNGVMMLALDPKYSVIVRFSNGDEECYKTGAMSTNDKQVRSGVSQMLIDSILNNTEPEINGLEGYKSLDVILTAFEARDQGTTLKVDHSRRSATVPERTASNPSTDSSRRDRSQSIPSQ